MDYHNNRKKSVILDGIQTQRQISYIDKLLTQAKSNTKPDGFKSVNPNPILGTEKEKQIINVGPAYVSTASPFRGTARRPNEQHSLEALSAEGPAGRGRFQDKGSTPLDKNIIRKLNEASMDQINYSPAHDLSGGKCLGIVQVRPRQSELSPTTSAEPSPYKIGRSTIKQSYQQSQLNRSSSRHLPAGLRQEGSSGGVDSQNAGSEAGFGGLKEYQKNVQMLNEIMKHQSQSQIQTGVIDCQQQTIDPDQEDLYDPPNTEFPAKSDIQIDITVDQQLQADKEFAQRAGQDLADVLCGGGHKMQSDKSTGMASGATRPDKQSFTQTQRQMLDSKKYYSINYAIEEEQTQQIKRKGSMHGVVGAAFKATMPAPLNSQRNQDIDQFLQKVRARKRSVNVDGAGGNLNLNLGPLNPIKVSKISTSRMKHKQNDVQMKLKEILSHRQPQIITDLQNKYNPQNSNFDVRPKQLVNLGNIEKTKNLPILGSSREIAKTDATQGVDKAVGDAATESLQCLKPDIGDILGFQNRSSGIASELLASFARSNSKVSEPKEDSKDAGAGVNFTSSHNFDCIDGHDHRGYLYKPPNSDIMASLNVESGPTIYPNLGFKIHTRTAAADEAQEKSQPGQSTLRTRQPHYINIKDQNNRKVTRRNQYGRAQTNETSNENCPNLPKIRQVFVSPKMAGTDAVGNQTPLAPPQKQRWNTPINGTLDPKNKTATNFNLSFEKNFGLLKKTKGLKYVKRDQRMNNTVEGFKIVQASNFPIQYRVPGDARNSPTSGGIFDQQSFKLRLAMKNQKRQSLCNPEKGARKQLQISAGSRSILLQQIDSMKYQNEEAMRTTVDKFTNLMDTASKTTNDGFKTTDVPFNTTFTAHTSRRHQNQRISKHDVDGDTIGGMGQTTGQITAYDAASKYMPDDPRVQPLTGRNSENQDNLSSNHEQSMEYLSQIRSFLDQQQDSSRQYQPQPTPAQQQEQHISINEPAPTETRSIDEKNNEKPENVEHNDNDTSAFSKSRASRSSNRSPYLQSPNEQSEATGKNEDQQKNAAQQEYSLAPKQASKRDASAGMSPLSGSPPSPSKSNDQSQSPKQSNIRIINQPEMRIPFRAKLNTKSSTDYNLYRSIEKQPHIPLKIELQIQEQIRAVERRMRIKKLQIQNIKPVRQNAIQAIRQSVQNRINLQQTLAKLPIDPDDDSVLSALSAGRAFAMSGQGGYDQFKLLGVQPVPLGLNTDRSREAKSRSMVFNNNGIFHGTEESIKMKNTQRDRSNPYRTKRPPAITQENVELTGNMGASRPHDDLSQRQAVESQQIIIDQNKLSYDKLGHNSQFNRAAFISVQSATQTPQFDERLFQAQDSRKQLKLAQNAKIERRIYNLYNDSVKNDIQRETKSARESIQKIQANTDLEKEEIKELMKENNAMKRIVRRYKCLIDNIDDEVAKYHLYQVDQRQSTIREAIQKGLSDFMSGAKDSSNFVLQPLKKGVIQSQEDLDQSATRLRAPSNMGKTSSMEPLSPLTPTLDGEPSSAFKLRHRISKISSASRPPQQLQRVDMQKVILFNSQIQFACRQDKPLDLVLALIGHVKTFLQCSKVMFIPIDFFVGTMVTSPQHVAKEQMQYIHSVEYTDINGGETRQLAAVAKTSDEVQDTVIIESLTDAREPELVINGNQMAILFRQQKEKKGKGQAQGPSFIIQAEFAAGKDKGGGRKTRNPGSPDSGPESPTGVGRPINGTEASIVQVVLQAVQVKFEQLALKYAPKSNKEALQRSTAALVSDIIRCTTLRGLMRTMNQTFMTYMGFNEINIMFDDQEKDQLYTITFGDDEEYNIFFQQKLKTAADEEEREALIWKDGMRDVTLKQSQMINYPRGVGITGEVYSSQKTVFINNFTPTKNPKFVNEIDNPKGIKVIRNLMIAALKREDGKTNGIIQLFNNKNPILRHDRKRMEAVARFFGGCIQNIEDKTRRITTRAAVEMDEDYFQQAFDDTDAALDPIKAELGKAHKLTLVSQQYLAENTGMYTRSAQADIAFDDEVKEQEKQ